MHCDAKETNSLSLLHISAWNKVIRQKYEYALLASCLYLTYQSFRNLFCAYIYLDTITERLH